MSKTCNSCMYGKQIYRRYGCCYGRGVNKIYCTVKDEPTQAENGCEQWASKKAEYDLSAARFDKAEDDIRALLDMLGEIR